MKYKRTLTDNPFVDEIVHATKILTAFTVLKDQDEADLYETELTARNGAIYEACRTGKERFELMIFNRVDLLKLGMTDRSTPLYPNGQILECLEDKYKIPPYLREKATQICKERVLRDYQEINNYYRMLNGLPNFKEPGLKLEPGDINDPDIIIDDSKYIHEMSDSEISALEELGVIDNLIERYPEKKYLRHLGSKKIDVLTARQAEKFDVLYVPTIDFEELRQKFIDRIEQNKHYVLRCIYSPAMKVGSEQFYDKFMALFIVLEAAIDLLSETQVFIAKKEVFNVRSIQYIFSMYGVPYYDEIPIKYQINMMKSLNRLIRYKATSINMIDICSLFGFPNIQIFKYYLFKDRRTDPNTDEYIFNYKEDGTEDVEQDFELKFLRVPLENSPDEYIKDPDNYLDYDTIADGDRYWAENGSLSDVVKKKLLEKEFNIVRTKYLSIDTTCEMSKLAFDLPYFFNMLYDDVKLEESLKLVVPYISNSTRFKFTDIFVMIFALGYMYNGLEDTIMDTTGKILHIMGFNFKADLGDLGAYIEEKGYTLEDLGASDFIIPTSSILTYDQLLEIFVKNREVYRHVTKAMLEADDKHIFDIYKKLYDSLMIMDFTNHYFRLPGTDIIAPTYTEFMKYRDHTLYKILKSVSEIGLVDNGHGNKVISDLNERRKEIDKYMQSIVIAMQEYIDSDEFRFIYSNIPGQTAEFIQRYVIKVITFFKSFRIDLLGLRTIYILDDEFENSMRFIDKIDHMDITYWKNEIMDPDEVINILSKFAASDRCSPTDRIYINRLRTILQMYDDKIDMEDKIDSISAKRTYNDKYEIQDSLSFTRRLID